MIQRRRLNLTKLKDLQCFSLLLWQLITLRKPKKIYKSRVQCLTYCMTPQPQNYIKTWRWYIHSIIDPWSEYTFWIASSTLSYRPHPLFTTLTLFHFPPFIRLPHSIHFPPSIHCPHSISLPSLYSTSLPLSAYLTLFTSLTLFHFPPSIHFPPFIYPPFIPFPSIYTLPSLCPTFLTLSHFPHSIPLPSLCPTSLALFHFPPSTPLTALYSTSLPLLHLPPFTPLFLKKNQSRSLKFLVEKGVLWTDSLVICICLLRRAISLKHMHFVFMILNMIISIFQGGLQTENIRSHRNKVWNSRSPEIKGGGGGFRILILQSC